MQWETPSFDEVKMDAEIGSYQEDTDPVHDPSFRGPARPATPASLADAAPSPGA
jgi:hypothetical protein